MGNALACSAALKSIEIFERENYMGKIAHIENFTREFMRDLQDDRIREIRILGGMVCVEVKNKSALKGFSEFARKRGVFSRPFLNCMYAAVPYIINDGELAAVLGVMKDWFKA